MKIKNMTDYITERLGDAGCRFQVAGCRLQVSGCGLPIVARNFLAIPVGGGRWDFQSSDVIVARNRRPIPVVGGIGGTVVFWGIRVRV